MNTNVKSAAFVRKDGSKFPVQLTITGLTDEEGKLTGYMGISYDITERKRQEDYISHLAHHDGLTGLPTRLLFHDRVEVALARVQRYGGKCALMLIDLDDFKDINDSMGHHAGDEVLVLVSKRLTGALRSRDWEEMSSPCSWRTSSLMRTRSLQRERF